MRIVYRNNAVYYALMPGLWLYRHAALRPLAWLLQRTISTPATHFAQPALVQDDGIGLYTCNYSKLLFLWAVLLGTAHITQRYPTAYGLADERAHGPETWWVQFIDPLLRSSRPATVIGANAAGKSTLLNAVSGDLMVDRSTLHINHTETTRRAAWPRLDLVARLLQPPMAGTCEALTIEENMALA